MFDKEITKQMIDAARADVVKTDGPQFREPIYTLKSRKNWSFGSETDAMTAHIIDNIVGRDVAPHLMKCDRRKLEKRIKRALTKQDVIARIKSIYDLGGGVNHDEIPSETNPKKH